MMLLASIMRLLNVLMIEVDLGILFYEAKKYFANILWPYAKLIDKALAKAAALDLKMIATAHGIIWRSHIQEIIAKYAAWGKGVSGSSVVIAYDTMWGLRSKWLVLCWRVLSVPVVMLCCYV